MTSPDAGANAITTCRIDGSDVLAPQGKLEATCVVDPFGSHDLVFTVSSPTSSVPDAAVGWSVQLSAAGTETDWVTGATTLTVPGGTRSFTIRLQAPATGGVADARVSVDVGLTMCNPSTSNCRKGATSISARVAGPDLGRVSMTCSSQSVAIPRANADGITCTINVPSDFGTTLVALSSVTLSSLPAGWSITTGPAGAIGADGSVTIVPGVTLAAGRSWSFTITLSPSCGATSPISLDVSSRIAGAGTEVEGPSATINAQADDVAQALTPSLVRSDLDWAFLASWEDQVGTGTLEYAVAAVGCSSWSVSVAAAPFLYSGPAPGTTIGPADLRLTSAGAPVTTSGEPGGVAATVATGSLDTAKIVMTAEEGGGNGTYVQELGIAVTVPGGTPAGTYQSTITITASSAP